MELKSFFAQDDEGNKLPGAECYVYQRGTENLIASIFKPNGLAQTNPFTTDNTGLAQFAAANGLYDVRVKTTGRDFRISLQFNDVTDTLTAAAIAADRSEAARDAALVAGNIKDSVAQGLATTSNGQRFSVLDPDANGYVILYLNNAGVAKEEKRYPSASISSLTVNIGKPYPLKSMVRDGITSAAPVAIQNSLLDIKILGARPGKLYRLEWVGTGTTAFGNGPNYELLINEYVKANYATNSADGAVPVISLRDIPATSVDAGETITRAFKSTRVEGIMAIVTYRPGALTPNSSMILNSPNTVPGWSWIIDENCYSQTPAIKETSLSINADKSFPMKSASRAASTSAENALFRAGIIDIKAFGVPAGYFLRLGWYGNGTLSFGATPNYGMEFELAEAATYGTTGISTKVTLYTDTDFEETVVSGTVVTRIYRKTTRPGLAISITYDKAVFAPTLGTSVIANYTGYNGYSWIVDPACYIPTSSNSPVNAPAGPLAFSHTATETLIAWRYSDTHDIRVAIGRYGVNLVNDIGGISFKPHGGQALTLEGTWSVSTPRGTDWIGPYILTADANGSGSTSQFTGGNHGYSGASGAPTAESVYRKAFANGRELIDGDAGFADKLTFQWENLVQGSNTRDVPRYILREQHSFTVRPGSIETSTRATALEALTIKRYYGLQAYLAGYNDSIHFLNGQQSARVAWADGLSSGASGDFPNVWAANARGASGFNLLMWVDRTYGIAKLANLDENSNMYFTSSTKMYNRLIDEGKPLSMAAGDSFCWRGGYAMAPNLGSGIDLGARYHDAGIEMFVAAITAAGKGRLALPTPDAAGKAVTAHSGSVTFSERVEPDGLAVSASGYAVGLASA